MKNTFNTIKSIKRKTEIMRESGVTKKKMIFDDLDKLGVNEGDIIFLHSSLKSIGYVEGGPDTVVSSILEKIGKTGTLIVPSYSMKETMYKTCMDDSYIFDVRTDVVGLGAIPKSVLKLKDVHSSVHPTHCITATGKYAKFITESHHYAESTFGKDSPWEKLLRLNGKIFGLGVSMGPITFYHVVEDLEKDFPIPVKIKKTYFVKCKDWKGKVIKVPINPLDPNFSKSRIDQESRGDLRNFFWKDFNDKKILNIGFVGKAKSWIAATQPFYNRLKFLMKNKVTIYTDTETLKKIRISMKIK